MSAKYEAWVACGFGENLDGKLYNSQVLVNSELKKIHLSRKTFLYDDDKTWGCEPSPIAPTFQAFNLYFKRLQKEVRCGTGICMDINWKDFAEGQHIHMELAQF